MTIYLAALTAALLGAIAPSFAAADSPLRALRFVPILALYPLFVAMAVGQGVHVAGMWWAALAGVGLLLVLIDDAALPRAKREPLLGAVWKNALLWPLVIPGATERLMTRLGIAPDPTEIRLPEPPRGSALMALADDEMLVAAYQILSGRADLTAEERTVLVAETFSREVHGGGLGQWFANTEHSISDTVDALRAVGAPATAALLGQAADADPAFLRALSDSFFALQRQEDLTSLVARFVRRHRSRCPALSEVPQRQ